MAKYLLLLWAFTIISPYALSQSSSNNTILHYNIAKKRFLVTNAGQYLYIVSQGQIDLDSAMLFVCKMYGQSRLLPYNEGYSDGLPSTETKLIDAGKIKEAISLTNNQKNESQIRLRLELGAYYLFKPGTNKADLDSALLFIEQATALSNTLKIGKWQNESQSLLGKYYVQAGNITQSQQCFANIVKACSKVNDEYGLALALENQAVNLPFNNPQELLYLQQSISIFRKLGAKEKELATLSQIIAVHFTADWKAAKNEMQQALELEQAMGYRHQQYLYNTLAYVTDLQGDFLKSLQYSNQSIAFMEETGDSTMASFFYALKGTSYYHLNKNEEALYWVRKSIENRTKETQLFWYKSFLFEAGLLRSLSRSKEALTLMKEISTQYPPNSSYDKMNIFIAKGRCYEALGEYKLAEKNYDEFVSLASNFPAQYIQVEFADSYVTLSSFYFDHGNKKKARFYLQKASAYADGKGDLLPLVNIHQMMFQLDSADKNYISAIRHYQISRDYNDSLLNYSQRKQMDEMEIKYQTKEKDKDISSLTNQSQLQQNMVKKANFARNMTFAGIALLLVIVGLLYNQYAIKKRNADALEIQQEEINSQNTSLQHLVAEKERLLKELHHRVKNNLQMVMSLLNSQSVYLDDSAALKATKNIQHRVQSMSLIHQKLYRTENAFAISMHEYIYELVEYLRDAFATGQRIQFKLSVQHITFDISQALPLGLILNEAITNAIKYAFPENRNGLVAITMQQKEQNNFLLSIIDNGIGLPLAFDLGQTNSLGITLMQGLSEDLNGHFSIENNHGTVLKIEFVDLQTDPFNTYPQNNFQVN